MAAHSYDALVQHVGHDIVCARYGLAAEPVNVAVECETCGVVLLDFDNPDPARRRLASFGEVGKKRKEAT